MVAFPRRIVPLTILLTTLGILTLIWNRSDLDASSLRLPFASSRSTSRNLLGAAHVAVFEQEDFHDEVHGAILWALKQFPDVHISFYRKPFRWGFADCIRSWYSTPPIDPDWFLDQLRQETTIRHIFLPTTDFSGKDWDNFQPKLRAVWEERRDDEKFNIIAMRHWGKYDQTGSSAWWAERDALSVVTLGDHVTQWLHDGQMREASGDRYYGEEKLGLQRMRVETFIPVFPPDELPPSIEEQQSNEFGEPEGKGGGLDMEEEDHDRLDMALIQSGNFDEGHRGMHAIFTELKEDVIADPELWGYQLSPEGDTYVPIPGKPRFVLKVLGFGGVGTPKELEQVISVERYLPYQHYYDRVMKSDIVLPAFGTDSYDQNRASSTMGVAASAMTPLLVTQKTADAYGWFCPEFAVIRPSELTEIEYIRRVRKGLIPWRSKSRIQKDLQKCFYDWTSHNMDLIARLFNSPPPPPKLVIEDVWEAEIRVPGE